MLLTTGGGNPARVARAEEEAWHFWMIKCAPLRGGEGVRAEWAALFARGGSGGRRRAHRVTEEGVASRRQAGEGVLAVAKAVRML